jgi:hypothetical protein
VHYAYWLWSPQAAVILSDSGYQVAHTENLKPAPLPQIERAEQSILDTAHEFMDDLIEFLDENVEVFEAWAGSEEQGKTKEHFINNAREFSMYVNINNSRRLFIELLPYLAEAELSYILPVLGKELYDQIIEQQKDGDLEGEEEEEIEPVDPELMIHIRRALAYLTMYHATAVLPVEIFPGFLAEKITGLQDNTRRQLARTEVLNSFSAKMKELGDLNLKRLHDYKAELDHLAELEEDPEAEAPEDTSFDPLTSRRSFSV